MSEKQKKGGGMPPSRVVQVVGLGASAGGLEALETFFENMPPDSGLAFVVVQHLSPDYKSLMVELLSRRTRMKVMRVEDGMTVEPNCIYLITPKKNMIIFHGRLLLTDQERNHINLPIDIFFRSLAEDQGARAVGIIFSGTGSDGMRGVRAIKEAGGMVMVQSEETAKFDGMPRSAISTGLVDFVLRPEEMPRQLIAYLQHPHTRPAEQELSPLATDEESMAKVLGLLHKQVGIDFTLYKPNTVVRRLERRMSINQILNLLDYARYLEKSPREVNTLFKELLIGVTSFFRDGEAYAFLQERVIPDLVENRSPESGIRVWSAGCSTGEEAYSLAILFQEYLEKHHRTADVKVFATDLDRDALDFAAAGIYPESCAADVSPERLARYFVRKGDNYHVSRKIREMVIFAHHNLLRDPPFTRIDLLSCRNLLIYLQPPVQKKLLSFFDFSLRPGGYLFLGSSETVGDLAAQFESVENKWKIYRCRGVGRRPIPELIGSAGGRDRLHLTRASTPSPFRFLDDERPMEPLYQALISDYVPPSVVVDENYEILHVFSDVSNYIRFPVGRLSTNILKTIRRELSPSLNTALLKAAKVQKDVAYRNVEYMEGEQRRSVDMVVRPFEDRRGQRMLFIIFFRESSSLPPVVEGTEVVDGRLSNSERIFDLEKDLQLTKENLQATIEELETSNEELQATNEELVSSNEELQSTNEELQSVNEELYTVNAEYQNKIQELVVLNNDIDNLLHSMTLGTLFLDENLNIRKFTSPVSSLFSVRDSDVGRPLKHLSHRLLYGALLEDVQAVLETLQGREKEVETEDAKWVLVLVDPYRKDGVPTRSGVVLSFVDVTPLKRAQIALQRERDLLSRTMDITPDALIINDLQGRILRVNRCAEELFGLEADRLKATSLAALTAHAEHPDGSPLGTEELPYSQVEATGHPCLEMQYAIHFPGGRTVHVSHNACPVRDSEGKLEAVLNTFRDLTASVRTHNALRRAEERFEAILRATGLGCWEWDIGTGTMVWSEAGLKLFGLMPGGAAPGWDDFLLLVHPDDRSRVAESLIAAARDGRETALEHRVVRADGKTARVQVRIEFVRDGSGRVVRLVGIVQEGRSRRGHALHGGAANAV